MWVRWWYLCMRIAWTKLDDCWPPTSCCCYYTTDFSQHTKKIFSPLLVCALVCVGFSLLLELLSSSCCLWMCVRRLDCCVRDACGCIVCDNLERLVKEELSFKRISLQHPPPPTPRPSSGGICCFGHHFTPYKKVVKWYTFHQIRSKNKFVVEVYYLYLVSSKLNLRYLFFNVFI